MNNQAHLVGEFRRVEAVAAGTITPGMLLEVDANGKFKANATASYFAERLVAEVDALQGKSLTDNYSSGDLVSANLELPGSESQVFLKAGETAVIGSFLASAGDGSLVVHDPEDSVERVPLAKSLAALDLSDSTAVKTLLHVRFL